MQMMLYQQLSCAVLPNVPSVLRAETVSEVLLPGVALEELLYLLPCEEL
jgi:hypothetical protein